MALGDGLPLGARYAIEDFEPTQVIQVIRDTSPGNPSSGGSAGAPGSVWFNSAGTPSGATGVVGDYHLNTSNGDVSKKTGTSTWTVQGNIKGPTGGTGAAGSTWYNQAGTPSGGTGINGDYDLNTTNGDVYKKISGTWTLQGNIRGPNGSTGAGVPTGGAKYSILRKNSTTDYDTSWIGPYVVNVRDYGATGNGSTDDSTAVNAAIAALVNGSTLYFPAGTYKTSQVIIASLTGVSVIGDGWASTIIRSNAYFDAGDGFGTTVGGSILSLASTASKITVRGITWDANCTHRKAGQQACKIDSSYLTFTDCRVINSGEYAVSTGRTAAITNLIFSNNHINASFADGINLYQVTNGTVMGNVVDGVDDDLLMIGKCSNVVAVGNYFNARTDLGTTVGRGIALLGESTNILVAHNIVNTVKQYGIYVSAEGSTRSQYVRIIGNTVKNACVNSGSSVYINTTNDVEFIDNVVHTVRSGAIVTIADWTNLTIMGGSLTSSYAGYSRGIFAEQSSGWSATWTGLVIKDVHINILNSSSNESIYLDPHSSVSMSTVLIDGVSSRQAVTGNYIVTNRLSTYAKIVNCTSLEGRSITNGGSGLAPTTANNN